MAEHQIVCVDGEYAAKGGAHRHILSVGTGTATGKPRQIWTVQQARKRIKSGTDEFYTVSETTKARASVRRFTCDCGVKTLRSEPDTVKDNNLDNLPSCPGSVRA